MARRKVDESELLKAAQTWAKAKEEELELDMQIEELEKHREQVVNRKAHQKDILIQSLDVKIEDMQVIQTSKGLVAVQSRINPRKHKEGTAIPPRQFSYSVELVPVLTADEEQIRLAP